jgi:predicted secreted protein
MAKTTIAGKDFKLFIEKDGDYVIFGCTDDATLNMESDTLTAACKDDDDDGWERSVQGTKRWSLDFSGLYRIIDGADADTNYSALELFDLFNSGVDAAVRLGPSAVGSKQFAGDGKLFNMSIGAPAGDNTTFSGTLTGQGPLTIFTVPSP